MSGGKSHAAAGAAGEKVRGKAAKLQMHTKQAQQQQQQQQQQ